MKLSEVLSQLYPTRGITSVLAATIGGGDIGSIIGGTADLGVTVAHAETELAKYRHLSNTCTSDAAYWGYMGDVEYWQVVVNLLKAAKLVGPDNLPDVPLPRRDGIVMDLLAEQRRFGDAVLRLAEQRVPGETR